MTFFERIKNLYTLLIDDDELIRDSMRFFFEAEACALVTMETAEQALELLNTQPFDIIISDYRLPGINGIEFFKRISALHPCSLKILVTAYMNKTVAEAAREAGVHELIEKPFTPATIEKALSRLLLHSPGTTRKNI